MGKRTEDRYAGQVVLVFPLGGIVPMLPDPYAASFTPPQLIDSRIKGFLLAGLPWMPGLIPTLSFAVTGDPVLRGWFTLLDVSTNADQFGVSFLSRDNLSLAIDMQALATRGSEIAVYAPPGISWEPVVSNQPPAPVDWQDAFSYDDGPATFLGADSVDLVRIEPTAALPHFQQVSSSVDTTADFTLPFGLYAHLATGPQLPNDLRPSFGFTDATYASGLRNGLQLAIIANPNSSIPHSSNAAVPPETAQLDGPALPGFTSTNSRLPPDPSVYGIQVLGTGPLDAGAFFDQQFTAEAFGGKYPGIPVSRIDISGYGTSMFSDWQHNSFDFAGVTRSRFDVLVGRTAYELLVLRSVIVPYSIRITRTIIFDRFDTGLVVKHDSGWKGVGNATFERLGPSQIIAGPLLNLSNFNNIQVAANTPISVVGPDSHRKVDFVPVTFDADVNLDFGTVSVLTNGKANVPVAATQIKGFAQVSVGTLALPDEILALMDKIGSDGVSAQLGCILNVGAIAPGTPQFTLNVSSLSVAATRARAPGKTYAAAVAVAMHGTPRLPRDGAWSIARRPRFAPVPTAVNASTPIPLIRGKSGAGDQWRVLDPRDALSVDEPETFYGILQGGGTSKTFFEHPIVDDSGTALNIDSSHLPNLADIGALLGATDIFPHLGAVLSLDQQPNPLNLVQDGFQQTYDQDINQPDRAIFELGIIKILLSYSAPDNGTVKPTHVAFRLTPSASPRWSLDIERISFKVLADGFASDPSDPLLTIYGNFRASETEKPSISGIQVKYGSALGLVEAVFSGLGPLIASVGGKVDLEVGFSQNRLTVRDFLAVPSIPLGFGDIRDITLELGFDAQIPSNATFHVGLGSKEKPFTWLVSPLSGTGAIVLGSNVGDLDVFVEAGIGAGLEIDLAVASGSASITLELAISIEGANISVAITLLGQAEVDVLGGLASASLTLAATLTITPVPPLPHFPPTDIDLAAAVAVGIHISICWVISIDFDGSWQFSQDVPVHL